MVLAPVRRRACSVDEFSWKQEFRARRQALPALHRRRAQATDRLAGLAERDHAPDLIVSDYHLPGGKTGVQVIESLRRALCAEIPAFLVSGDTNPEPLREAGANGYYLLHKPVDPMALRAMVSQVLRKQQAAPAH